MSVPLISVIIVCRNPGPRLQTALASVWAQPGADCEIVVIDGASSDGTREWLEAQRNRLGTLISEPDGGIYDAMNKGVAGARGDWVLFLGSDDSLLSGALSKLAPFLRQTDAGVVVGEVAYNDGRIYRLTDPGTAIRRNFLHHQAACYRRTLFALHGSFDTKFRIMADYEFNLRLLKAGARFQPAAVRVSNCDAGGLSDSGGWLGYREEISVRHLHFPSMRRWLWDIGSVVRCLRKKLLRNFR